MYKHYRYLLVSLTLLVSSVHAMEEGNNAPAGQPELNLNVQHTERSDARPLSFNRPDNNHNANSSQAIPAQNTQQHEPSKEEIEIRPDPVPQPVNQPIPQQPIPAIHIQAPRNERVIRITCNDQRSVELPRSIAELSLTIAQLATQPHPESTINIPQIDSATLWFIVDVMEQVHQHWPNPNELLRSENMETARRFRRLAPIDRLITNKPPVVTPEHVQYSCTYFNVPFIKTLLTASKVRNINPQTNQNQHPQRPHLVADDITQPTRWKKEKKSNLQIPQKLHDSAYCIRQWYRHEPEFINNLHNVEVFVVHGTIGDGSDDFFQSDKKPSDNFRHIKRNMAEYATIKKRDLDLMSFKWEGEGITFALNLNDTSRQKAAKKLKKILKHWRRIGRINNNTEIMVIAHSHGCTVANILTNICPIPIDIVIYFGCPVRNDGELQPRNCKLILYFYSSTDKVARAGAANENAMGHVPVGGAMVLASPYVATMCPPLGGAMAFGGKAIMALGAYFTVRDVVTYNPEFPARDGAITVGFNLKIDGDSTYHSRMIGTGLMDAAPYLLQVIKYAQRHYPYMYSRSGVFYLNIDRKSKNYPITLVIKQEDNKKPPATFESITHDTVRTIQTNNIDSPNEQTISNRDAEIFRKTYGKKIDG